MKNDVRDRIKALSKSAITFEDNWTWDVYLAVLDIIEANGWKDEGVVECLPPKIQTIYLLEELKATINNDGFLSVFYNGALSAIKRLRNAMRNAISVPGLQNIGDLFDEAFQLVENKLKWPGEYVNLVSLMDGAQPYDFFGCEITDRIDEIEKLISAILFADEFGKLMELYLKS